MDNLNLPEAKQLVNNLLNKSKYKDFLVGISGGVDSLVLLSIINELKLTYGYNFRAIHINHNFSSNGPFLSGKGSFKEGVIRVLSFAYAKTLKPMTITSPLHVTDWFKTISSIAKINYAKNKTKPLEYLEGVIDVGYKVEKVN